MIDVPGRDASTMSHRLKLTCSHERLAAVKAMTGVLHPLGSHLNIRPGSILTMVWIIRSVVGEKDALQCYWA